MTSVHLSWPSLAQRNVLPLSSQVAFRQGHGAEPIRGRGRRASWGPGRSPEIYLIFLLGL